MTLKCVRIGENKQRIKEMVMPTISFFRPLTNASAGICARVGVQKFPGALAL